MDNLTETHLGLLRQQQKAFVEAIRAGNVPAADAAAADFSSTVICPAATAKYVNFRAQAEAAPFD